MRRRAAWTAAAVGSPARVIEGPMGLTAWGQIAAGAVVEIAWVTEVFRQGQVVHQEVAALSAVAQGE